MARSKKLSDDEVEALIGVLGDEDSENAPNPNYQAEIRKVELGVDDLSILGDYFALRMINERFCRLCKSIFASILRLQPKVSAFPPEIKTFGEYKSELDEFMSLTISKVDALKGIQLLALEPELVSALTSSFYQPFLMRFPTYEFFGFLSLYGQPCYLSPQCRYAYLRRIL